MSKFEEYQGDGREILRWLWHGYLKKYWVYIVVAVVLMAAEGASYGALSYLIQPMFENVFELRDQQALLVVSAAIFGVFLMRAVAGFAHKVLMNYVGYRVAAKLQGDLLGHMLTLDTQWFQRTAPGNLISRVQGDTNAAATIWSTVLTAGGRDVVALLSLFAVAISIDWRWTLIALVGAPLLMLPLMALQRMVRRMARRSRSIVAQVTTRLDEILHGVVPIKLNGLEARETDRFVTSVDENVATLVKVQVGRAAIPAMIDIVAGLGLFGVVYLGGGEVIAGDKSTGEFMSFIFAMALVFDPLRRLGSVSGAWQTALASLERIHVVFLARPTIVSPATPAKLSGPTAEADIEFDNVAMSYVDTPVLNGLSFRAPAGQVTALVGASGAGKSTVFNLLARLVDPQSGTITLGGVALDTFSIDALRNMFSVVTQDALLFDETLRDNVLLGRTDISDAQLQAALDAAHVSEFLKELPDGLETMVGTRGSSLSGGQRQRVVIARALVRNAPILLLDEATSALDSKSEKIVQNALDRLSHGRTTLVIAHRLATVRDAHQIVVMDKGRVVETGKHAELLAKDGMYAGLYRLQFSEHEGQ